MTYRLVKTSKCSTLSKKSDLTYHIGCDEEGQIQIRVTDNSGNGFFSKEWVTLSAIEKALSTCTDSITAIALWPPFKGSP